MCLTGPLTGQSAGERDNDDRVNEDSDITTYYSRLQVEQASN